VTVVRIFMTVFCMVSDQFDHTPYIPVCRPFCSLCWLLNSVLL